MQPDSQCIEPMAQLHDYVVLTFELAARVASLCDTPYEPNAISSMCIENRWKLIPLEDWEAGGDPFLRIQIADPGPPMIAMWGAECMAGLPLTVVFQDDVTVDISKLTWDSYDSRFYTAKALCEAQFGPPIESGTYASDWRPHLFHYAFFRRQHSTLALLQHHEGDGHLGNDASLDIRIIPMAAALIRLPLKTNLIF